jgi:hypothetical protein
MLCHSVTRELLNRLSSIQWLRAGICRRVWTCEIRAPDPPVGPCLFSLSATEVRKSAFNLWRITGRMRLYCYATRTFPDFF